MGNNGEMMKKKQSKKNKIPVAFKSVVKAVEEVAAEFESKEPFEELGEKRWIRNIDIAEDAHVGQIAFVLETELSLVAIYVILRLPDARPRIHEFLMALTRANFGLLNGCFELDFDTGEARFRSVLNLRDKKTDTVEVAQLLAVALTMARTYVPAFQEVIKTDADPLEAIDKIES
jgi:hypothetical protein